MTPTRTDTRRITEADPIFLALHAATVAQLRHSLALYAQELQHATTLPSPHAFLTRHTAILTQAYVTGHAEGATAIPSHPGAPPDPSRMHRTLSFYVPSVAKMAAEGLRAWQTEHGQARTFADPVLPEDEADFAPYILEWAQGAALGARLIMQGDVVWPAMQNGYLEAGAKLYTQLYWDLDPLAKRHCIDCPGIAAASPYDPPGSGGNELNQTPGDGQTECGAGCRCSLRYAEGGEALLHEDAETYTFYRPDQQRSHGRFAFEGAIRQSHHADGMSGGGGGHADHHLTVELVGPHGEARVRSLFGRDLSDHELGQLVGAPHAALLRLSGSREFDMFHLEMRGPLLADGKPAYTALRTFARDGQGRLTVENFSFKIHESLQRSGMGTRIFAEQVAGLRHLGVDHITTIAARNHQANGYYTWARLGYSMRLSKEWQTTLRQVFGPRGLGKAQHLSDLMRTAVGRAWWRVNGRTWRGEFDLHEGSTSMRMLRQYLRHKHVDIQLAEPTPTGDEDFAPLFPVPAEWATEAQGEEIPWDADDEAAADAAMDAMNAEDAEVQP